MCKPQLVNSAKTELKGFRSIRLSSQFILPISLLAVISFLAGCFVRLSHLSPVREGIRNGGYVEVCNDYINQSINVRSTSVHDDYRVMAIGQQISIEVTTKGWHNEVALQNNAMHVLAAIVQDASHASQKYSNRRNGNMLLAISTGGHIAMHFFHHAIVIDIYLRDYNHTSRHQQQIIQSILNETSELFGEATIRWSHKLRGFRESLQYIRHANPFDHELGVDVLRRRDEKKLLVSTKTKFQNVDIYELPRRRFNGDATRAKTFGEDGLLGKDKALYLDGVLQSSLYGDSAYHEALVHPGMITHDKPRRVAIIGGGEGATLREVLKHNTVEHVVMLEIDEELTMLSREYLSEWNDCSSLLSSSSLTQRKISCFDDERVVLHFVDAFQWFVDGYSEKATDASAHNTATRSEAELFDVIIMDALDPDDFVEFADKLYNNSTFIESLYNGLSTEGIFVVQLGAAPDVSDPSDENGAFRNRAKMITKLQEIGFESIHIYEEDSDFFHPWSILVALKDYETRSNWYRNAAEIQLELHRRVRKTTLFHFDAATFTGYQLPSKAFESIFCRQDDEPEECDEYYGFWPGINNVPISDIKVQKSGVSEQAGRGVFAVDDIPEESMIDLEQGTKAFYVAASAWDVFDTMYDWAEASSERADIESEMSGMKYFIEGYGYACQLMGGTHHTIDSGIMTFSNHGCNGTYNYGDEYSSLTESTVDLTSNRIPDDFDCTAIPYSPVQERHLRQILSAGDVTLREVKAGEEILVNYVTFADPNEWMDDVRRLNDQCNGQAVGEVSKYESEA